MTVGSNTETNMLRTHYYFNREKIDDTFMPFCQGYINKSLRRKNFISYTNMVSFFKISLLYWLNIEIENDQEMLASFESFLKNNKITFTLVEDKFNDVYIKNGCPISAKIENLKEECKVPRDKCFENFYINPIIKINNNSMNVKRDILEYIDFLKQLYNMTDESVKILNHVIQTVYTIYSNSFTLYNRYDSKFIDLLIPSPLDFKIHNILRSIFFFR